MMEPRLNIKKVYDDRPMAEARGGLKFFRIILF